MLKYYLTCLYPAIHGKVDIHPYFCELSMSHTCQPPDNKKNAPLEKPSDGQTQPPAKAEEKTAVSQSKQDVASKLQEPEKKETAPVKQPELPFNPPPGANQGVPIKPPAGQHQIGAILEPALWLIGILAVGAILIAWLKKTREKQAGPVALTAHDQLTSFRQAVEEGEMTDEEFKKVKALLAEKIRKPVIPITTDPKPAQETEHPRQEPSP